jgi:hypothetical protein
MAALAILEEDESELCRDNEGIFESDREDLLGGLDTFWMESVE